MTYNVFRGTLNPIHSLTLCRPSFCSQCVQPVLKAVYQTTFTLQSGVMLALDHCKGKR